jgi:rRNA-processing protein FCF1
VEDLPTHPQLDVVRAPADGDTAIAALAADLAAEQVLVVTADRELRERVRSTGAATVGPETLLRALPG